MFGSVDSRFYTPYTVEQYLKSAGVVTVVRVLGLNGYQADTVAIQASSVIGASTTLYTASLAILAPSRGGTNGTQDLSSTAISGSWDSFVLSVQGSDTTLESYNLKNQVIMIHLFTYIKLLEKLHINYLVHLNLVRCI